MMVSQTVAQTLRIHGDLSKGSTAPSGINRYRQAPRDAQGRYPSGRLPEPVPQRGYIYPRCRSAGQKAIWRLSPDVLEFCATQEVTA